MNGLIGEILKSMNTLLGPTWKFVINLVSLKGIPDNDWSQGSAAIRIFIEGINKDLYDLDPDSLAAMKDELGHGKIIELIYDEKKTSALTQGCVAVAYENGIINVYWRILPKILYPHLNKSIGDYVVDNCQGPSALSGATKKRVIVSEATLFFDGVAEQPPKHVAHDFISITGFLGIENWRNKTRNPPVYVCLRASEIITIVPINEGKYRCSEIQSKNGAKYYTNYHPALILEVMAEAEKGAPVAK